MNLDDSDKSANVEEIINELSECREDERNCENLIIQIISTAGAILGAIIGTSIFGNDIDDSTLSTLSFLSDCIFIAAFGYITSLGIKNVLRYHYMQTLEDKLTSLNGSDIIHWISHSSPVTTRNPLHINSTYSLIHYVCYAGATLFAIIFSFCMTFYQYSSIENHIWIDKLGMICLFLFTLFLFIAFIFSSFMARRMHNFAVRKSKIKRNKRINGIKNINKNKQENKNLEIEKSTSKFVKVMKFLGYFLYPKTKDLQKPGLIIIGSITGIFLRNGYLTGENICTNVYPILFTLFVVDFLTYQARYQWNDIRGLKEDVEAGKTDRLPINVFGKKIAVTISMCLAVVKIFSTFIIIYVFGGEMAFPLYVCVVSIMFISILYEFMRSRKKQEDENIEAYKKDYSNGVFFSVSLGYPIRFLAGLWTAWPGIWNSSIIVSGDVLIPQYAVILLLFSYVPFGAFSAILPWTHEVIFQTRNKRKIMKIHYQFLFDQIQERYNDSERSSDKLLPLREKGDIGDIWNKFYIGAIVILSIVWLIVQCSYITFIMEVLLVGITIKLCFASKKYIIIYSVLSMGYCIVKMIFSYFFLTEYLFCILICFHQIFFTGIYFFLRYMFEPDFNFIEICKEIVMKLFICIIGEETWCYINESK